MAEKTDRTDRANNRMVGSPAAALPLDGRQPAGSAAGSPQVQHNTACDDKQDTHHAGRRQPFLENIHGNQGSDNNPYAAPESVSHAQVDPGHRLGQAEIAGDIQEAGGGGWRQLRKSIRILQQVVATSSRPMAAARSK